MVGEVFNFGIDNFQKSVGTAYDYGDRRVDFFDHGFDGLINMGFATHARAPMPDLFAQYARAFDGEFAGRTLLNYISSHDDMEPLDPERTNPFGNAIKLMLAPGAVQIYYGDELSRPLVAPETTGDARLRTAEGAAILDHWRRLGRFRNRHPAIGAGEHVELSRIPFVFARTLHEDGVSDRVVVAHSDVGPFTAVPAGGVFADGERVRDAYTGDVCSVNSDRLVCSAPRRLALFEATVLP
jgi:alpha-amylase